MANNKTTRRTSAKKSVPAPKGIITNPNDAQSWLYLNPLGPSAEGITFGVLRKTYGDRENTAAAFGREKACPVPPAVSGADGDWMVTAERIDVVLPRGADDSLSQPLDLLMAMDKHALPAEKALLIYVTLPFPGITRLHHAWESARAFATLVAAERQLASMVTLHAPGVVSCANPVHAHLCISPRTAGDLGMRCGIYDRDLTCDTGQRVMEDLWRRHTEAWT